MLGRLGSSHGESGEQFFVHLAPPIVYGGDVGDSLTPPPILPLNRIRLRRPINPGLPPVYHVPLPAPEAYRLLVPQAQDKSAPHQPRFSAERTRFPVAGPPVFSPLAPAPPSGDISANKAAGETLEATTPDAPPASLRSLGQASHAAAPSLGQRFDPVYPFLLFLALGVGTSYIDLDVMARYTLLWTVLVGLGVSLTLVDSPDAARPMTPASLGWGISFGLVFSLPLFVLASSGLADMVGLLYPGIDRVTLFQSLAFVSPLSETLFFRGAFQQRRGLAASVLAAGISGIVLYGPAVFQTPLYLVAAGIFTTVLAGVYSFIRSRYGLAAAYLCQVTVNLMLLFVPSLLAG